MDVSNSLGERRTIMNDTIKAIYNLAHVVVLLFSLYMGIAYGYQFGIGILVGAEIGIFLLKITSH